MLLSAGVVMLLGISAQVVAFLRTAVIAALFGASLDVDAYNLGLIAPIFASNVIGAWLQVAFVGRYTELLTQDSREHAAAYRGGMLVLVFVGALSLTSLCLLLPQQIMGLFMPAWRPDMLTSAAAALQPAALILVPTAIGDFLSLVMNAHRRFFLAAAAPLTNALVSIAGLLTWSNPDLAALVWTLLAGSVTQCLVVGAAVYWLRLPFPIWKGAVGADMRRALLLALPMLPSAMLVNATAPILQFSAARLGEGAVAIYGYASRLHGSISQVLILGLSTVLLPHFAALWSRGQKDEIILLFRRLARCTLLVVAYLTVGIFLMGETATRVLFQRGAFDAPQTTQVSAAWLILSLSLFPYVYGTFIAKFCQAISDARSLLASSVILFASTWLAGWYGASIGTVGGVAAAYTASFVVMGFYWLPWLSRRIDSRSILRDIATSLFRCALILAPTVAVNHWFRPFSDSPIMDLICRGTIYSITALLIFVATRSYIWFLAKSPD